MKELKKQKEPKKRAKRRKKSSIASKPSKLSVVLKILVFAFFLRKDTFCLIQANIPTGLASMTTNLERSTLFFADLTGQLLSAASSTGFAIPRQYTDTTNKFHSISLLGPNLYSCIHTKPLSPSPNAVFIGFGTFSENFFQIDFSDEISNSGGIGSQISVLGYPLDAGNGLYQVSLIQMTKISSFVYNSKNKAKMGSLGYEDGSGTSRMVNGINLVDSRGSEVILFVLALDLQNGLKFISEVSSPLPALNLIETLPGNDYLAISNHPMSLQDQNYKNHFFYIKSNFLHLADLKATKTTTTTTIPPTAIPPTIPANPLLPQTPTTPQTITQTSITAEITSKAVLEISTTNNPFKPLQVVTVDTTMLVLVLSQRVSTSRYHIRVVKHKTVENGQNGQSEALETLRNINLSTTMSIYASDTAKIVLAALDLAVIYFSAAGSKNNLFIYKDGILNAGCPSNKIYSLERLPGAQSSPHCWDLGDIDPFCDQILGITLNCLKCKDHLKMSVNEPRRCLSGCSASQGYKLGEGCLECGSVFKGCSKCQNFDFRCLECSVLPGQHSHIAGDGKCVVCEQTELWIAEDGVCSTCPAEYKNCQKCEISGDSERLCVSCDQYYTLGLDRRACIKAGDPILVKKAFFDRSNSELVFGFNRPVEVVSASLFTFSVQNNTFGSLRMLQTIEKSKNGENDFLEILGVESDPINWKLVFRLKIHPGVLLNSSKFQISSQNVNNIHSNASETHYFNGYPLGLNQSINTFSGEDLDFICSLGEIIASLMLILAIFSFQNLFVTIQVFQVFGLFRLLPVDLPLNADHLLTIFRLDWLEKGQKGSEIFFVKNLKKSNFLKNLFYPGPKEVYSKQGMLASMSANSAGGPLLEKYENCDLSIFWEMRGYKCRALDTIGNYVLILVVFGLFWAIFHLISCIFFKKIKSRQFQFLGSGESIEATRAPRKVAKSISGRSGVLKTLVDLPKLILKKLTGIQFLSYLTLILQPGMLIPSFLNIKYNLEGSQPHAIASFLVISGHYSIAILLTLKTIEIAEFEARHPDDQHNQEYDSKIKPFLQIFAEFNKTEKTGKFLILTRIWLFLVLIPVLVFQKNHALPLSLTIIALFGLFELFLVCVLHPLENGLINWLIVAKDVLIGGLCMGVVWLDRLEGRVDEKRRYESAGRILTLFVLFYCVLHAFFSLVCSFRVIRSRFSGLGCCCCLFGQKRGLEVHDTKMAKLVVKDGLRGIDGSQGDKRDTNRQDLDQELGVLARNEGERPFGEFDDFEAITGSRNNRGSNSSQREEFGIGFVPFGHNYRRKKTKNLKISNEQNDLKNLKQVAKRALKNTFLQPRGILTSSKSSGIAKKLKSGRNLRISKKAKNTYKKVSSVRFAVSSKTLGHAPPKNAPKAGPSPNNSGNSLISMAPSPGDLSFQKGTNWKKSRFGTPDSGNLQVNEPSVGQLEALGGKKGSGHVRIERGGEGEVLRVREEKIQLFLSGRTYVEAIGAEESQYDAN